jgi:endo-1,4-beta-xylanase
MEPNQGQISYDMPETVLKWCTENDISMRGHCVFYGSLKQVQPWVKALDDKALEAALHKRAVELVTHFKGRIREYDVNNEMVHGNYYADHLGDSITVKMFQWVHQTDPDAVLYVNDNRILSRDDLPLYEKQIEQLLKAGVPLGGIGCQGHFWEKNHSVPK